MPQIAALPVLTSKVVHPSTDPALLRPGTLARIAEGAVRRLLLVRAPAGYGKTTVLVDAARRLGWRSAWYTVDMLDRDPWTFVAGIVAAVDRCLPGFGGVLRSRLADLPDVPLPKHELLALLLRAFESALDGPLHLVLDDYHEGSGDQLDEVLDYLLATMPADLHVVVATRYEPRFGTSRLRLRDDVAELTMDDLRLARSDACGLLARAAGRPLGPERLGDLLDEAEGWPAGLVLAGRALRAGSAPANDDLTVRRLKGDLFTYLAEQVFSRESRAVRAFLKRSCCLERITPELAARVGGSSEAPHLLAQLVERGAFTFRDEDGRFRYHRLFRDYLRHKATQEDGAESHRRDQLTAAEACRDSGHLVEALRLYFGAGEPERAVHVIAEHGDALLDRCPVTALRDWSRLLQDVGGALLPWHHLLEAHLRMRDAQYDRTLAHLRSAVTYADGDRDLRFAIACGIERTLYWKSEYDGAADACRDALTTARRPAHRMHALVSLGAALVAMNDWPAAEAALAEAESLAADADPHELVRLEGQRLAMLTVQGRFHEAVGQARSARSRVESLMPPSFVVAYLNLLAQAHLYLGDYEPADAALDAAQAVADRFDCRFCEPLLWDARGQVRFAVGDTAGGLELCRRAEQHSGIEQDLGSRALALSHIGTGHRRSGDLERAADAYMDAAALVADTTLHHPRLTCRANRDYTACLVDVRRSARSLDTLAREAEAFGLPFVVTRCALFAALVGEHRGGREEALWRLRQLLPTALELGHVHLVGHELAGERELVEDFLRTSPDAAVSRQLLQALAVSPRGVGALAAALRCGETMARSALEIGAAVLRPADVATLLRRARRHRLPSVRRLAADLQAATGWGISPGDPLPELTKRETEVLALIAEGRRNAEIAEILVLEPTTVKKYVNRIFSKLGVDDRVQATLRFRRHHEAAG